MGNGKKTKKETQQHTLQRLEKIRAQRDTFARWIDQRGNHLGGDHACAQCHPHGDALVQGFVCAYHAAVALLDEQEASHA